MGGWRPKHVEAKKFCRIYKIVYQVGNNKGIHEGIVLFT
jgi:hypothetical protein